MEQKAKEKMEFLLSQLRIDVTRDAELARSYFILSLIRALTAGKTSIDLCIRSKKFQKYLQQCSVEFFCPFDEISEVDVAAIDSLLELIKTYSLDEYRKFFDVFSPFIVADWEKFAAQFRNFQGDGIMLASLCYLLESSEEVIRETGNYLLDWVDIYKRDNSGTCYLSKIFSFNTDQFRQCWESVFVREHGVIKTKINGAISNAIKEYRAHFVPLERLLEDYYQIKKCGKAIEHAINPWRDIQRNIRKIPVETGVSVAET